MQLERDRAISGIELKQMAFPMPSPIQEDLLPVEWSDQDAAFFDGVFSQQPNQHDFSIQENKENLDPASAINSNKDEAVVDGLILKEVDIICVKGAHPSHPGNQYFKQFIDQHKDEFDALPTNKREALAETMFRTLRDERNTRFFKPSDSNPNILEPLDDERIVRKIWAALRDCRRTVKNSKKKKPAKSVRWEDHICSGDEAIREEIATLYKNETLLQAMKNSWKDEFDSKKVVFEEQLVHRYNVAIERGISPNDFTDRLTNVLLKEIQGV